MTDAAVGAKWSHADQPYSIAVSEAMWWHSAVRLGISRLDEPGDERVPVIGSKQIDARYLIFALVQLCAASRLEQRALRDLAIDGQPVLMSGYLGSIGFGHPAAMGAWAAHPDRPVVAVTGDGGFGQYLAELTTAVK